MKNQLPKKEDILEMLEGSQNSLREIERLINLAEQKGDFTGVAKLFEIKLGLENVIVQARFQIRTLEDMEKVAQNGNDQQGQN